MFSEKLLFCEIQRCKPGSNLAESSKEGYGLKGAVFPMMNSDSASHNHWNIYFS
jgi:hypothetical protein